MKRSNELLPFPPGLSFEFGNDDSGLAPQKVYLAADSILRQPWKGLEIAAGEQQRASSNNQFQCAHEVWPPRTDEVWRVPIAVSSC
jgi:hypothetical protein